MIERLRCAAITCAGIFSAIALLLNLYYRQPLFVNGVQVIERYQQRMPYDWFIQLQNFISFMGDTEVLPIVTFFLYIFSRRKVTVVVFLIYLIINIYINNILKVLFMDPRPYMYSMRVQQLQWKCPAEYGNPSGHSWLVFQFYGCLIFDLISRIRKTPWLMILPIVMAGLIPQSRMYLGAHSTNQVVMGLLLGLSIQVIYRYVLHAAIYDWIHGMILDKSYDRLAKLLLINVCLAILSMLIYERQISHPFPQYYLNNLKIMCPEITEITKTRFLIKNFAPASMINVVFGLLAGIWASSQQSYMYLYGQWKYNSLENKRINRLKRILLELLPAMLVAIVLYWYLPSKIDNVYLKLGIQGLGAWLIGFFLIVFTHNILLTYGNIVQVRPTHGFVQAHYDIC